MLGYVYGKDHLSLTPTQDVLVKAATPIGAIVGQLVFGFLADKVGRKRMCTSLSPALIGSFGSAVLTLNH